MQQDLLKFFAKKFKKAETSREYPFFHGTADILLKYRRKIYIFELKLKINKQLINQCKKHRIVADYITAIAYKPKKNETKLSWEIEAQNNNINLLWMEELKKQQIKNLIKNKDVNREVREVTYGI